MPVGDNQTFVIAGASLAGAKAAETLRTEGFEGRIVLVGDEPVRPYERPPLSKGYLRGEVGFDAAAVHPEGYYDDHSIELRTSTTITAIDPTMRSVALENGETLPYDQLLLSTGAAPRVLSTPGSDLPGIHYLRSIASCDALRNALAKADRVVVVGAGWIGSEVAASARQLGKDVAMIEAARVPLERVLGNEVGEIFKQLHEDHGVALYLGVGVEGFRGADSVEEVTLSDGTAVPGDLVVVGVGVTPRTGLAEAAGLDIDNGVLVDEYLATSMPGIWAAGDIANAFHPAFGKRIRLEHWSAALNQGPAAARNMLGQKTPYTKIPYFFSDQYDLGMEYSGYATDWDAIVIRGDRAKREFVAFWLAEGRVLAGMNVNTWGVTEQIASLVESKRVVDPRRLEDPDVDISELANRD
jgi:3-phenylpropionate/trans-cinnamate dioxygenase ferredoxin reductase subunit